VRFAQPVRVRERGKSAQPLADREMTPKTLSAHSQALILSARIPQQAIICVWICDRNGLWRSYRIPIRALGQVLSETGEGRVAKGGWGYFGPAARPAPFFCIAVVKAPP